MIPLADVYVSQWLPRGAWWFDRASRRLFVASDVWAGLVLWLTPAEGSA